MIGKSNFFILLSKRSFKGSLKENEAVPSLGIDCKNHDSPLPAEGERKGVPQCPVEGGSPPL
jgi:hypothetical protein